MSDNITHIRLLSVISPQARKRPELIGLIAYYLTTTMAEITDCEFTWSVVGISAIDLVLATSKVDSEAADCCRLLIGAQRIICKQQYIESMLTEFSKTDVLVVASEDEGMSMVALEAVACNVPVVTTSSNGAVFVSGRVLGLVLVVPDFGPTDFGKKETALAFSRTISHLSSTGAENIKIAAKLLNGDVIVAAYASSKSWPLALEGCKFELGTSLSKSK